MTISTDQKRLRIEEVLRLREDLRARVLRAAALHGLAEGVCNHGQHRADPTVFFFGRFLLNPRGLLLERGPGRRHRPGRRPGPDAGGAPRRRGDRHVHPWRHPSPGPQGLRPAYPHAVRDRADAHLRPRSRHDAVAERDALPWPGRRRRALQRPRARCIRGRTDRGGDGRCRHRLLGNHGIVVCGERMAHAYDDLYYSRARLHGPGAGAIDRPAAGSGRGSDRGARSRPDAGRSAAVRAVLRSAAPRHERARGG